MATFEAGAQAPSEGMLAPYRVLDLTEWGCMLGGKLLADLGADVIKIEPPGGSPGRSVGPFWHGQVHPEMSLFWWAYNVNKRSITLNIESADGAAIFRRLVGSADFVVESFSAGYMAGLGLGYEGLSRINPGVIVASITPFGQTGPKAHNAWSDLSVWASGGPLYLTGHPDRPPVGISFSRQATLHGGAEAAVACLIAHYYRERSGEGQYIDVSVQAAVYLVMTSWMEFWETAGTIPSRQAEFSGVGRGHQPSAPGTTRERRQLYPTKDGYIMYTIEGEALGSVRSSAPIVEWMKEDGVAPDWLLKFDWTYGVDLNEVDEETLDAVEESFTRFFQTKTKLEISQRSARDHFMVGAVHTPEDVATNPQFQARGFFRELWHEELEANVTYCGPYVKASEAPPAIWRPPPRIGEHNDEVYRQELGMTTKELVALTHGGVV